MRNEDSIARITRTVRDRAYRATGYNKYDEAYQAVVWALEQIRLEVREDQRIMAKHTG